MNDREWGIRNAMTGKAGEHAVACQLFLRDTPVMFPNLDLGFDLMSYNGCRIQVKSAHLCTTDKMIEKTGRGSYCYPLPRTKRRAVTNDRSTLVIRSSFVDICDIVVFWGIEENRFWIVPAELADKSTGLILGAPDPTNRFVGNIDDMRKMREAGCSLGKISKKYGGLAKTSILQFINNPDKSYQEASITSQVRQCENAWEHITEFKSSIKQDSGLHLVDASTA